MAKMKLEIITVERALLSDEVDMLVAPGIDGELGILPHHASLLTALKSGELHIVKDGKDTYLAVGGGFLEVLANKVIVLVDSAERSDEIDEARAQAAMNKAQEAIANRSKDQSLEAAISALRRAEVRIAVSRRRRGSSVP